MEDLRRKRQQVTSFLLRQGRSYAGRTTWSGRHRRWLAEQTFDHPEHQLVLQEATAKEAEARLDRMGAALAEIVPTWSMAPVVAAYQAMRGVNFLAATTLVAEVGDLRRFDNPAQLMSFLVPSEHSTRPDAARSPKPASPTGAGRGGLELSVRCQGGTAAA